MLDAVLASDAAAGVKEAGALVGGAEDYLVATIHRAASTDDADRLRRSRPVGVDRPLPSHLARPAA